MGVSRFAKSYWSIILPGLLVAILMLPGCTNNLAQPTTMQTPKPAPAPTIRQRQSIDLTILHTNDVQGETDPCG